MIFDDGFLNILPEGCVLAEWESKQLMFANSAFCRMTGYSMPELINNKLTTIFPTHQAEEICLKIDELIRKKRDISENVPLVKSDGELIYSNITATTIAYHGTECAMLFLRDITSRMTVMKRLERSEQRLLNAQRIGNIGDWEWNIKTNELTWSEQVFRIFGTNPPEFVPTYHGFLEFVHPEDRDELVKAVNSSVNNGTPYGFIHRIKRKDGKLRYVHEQGEVLYDGQGNPLRMYGTVQDITVIKLGQIRLKKNQIELKGQQKALNNAALVSETDLRGKIIYANKQFCQVSGYSHDELIGQNHRILRHPDMPAELYIDLWRTISTGKVWTGIIKNRNKQGGAYWVKATITPVLNELGKPIKYIGVRVDITDRMLLEEQLRIKKSAIDSSINGIIISNIEGKVIYVNKYALKMYGYASEDEVLGKHLSEVSKNPYTNEKLPQFKEQGWWKGENLIRHDDGTEIHVLISGNFIYDANQQPTHIMASINDITETKLAEKKLQETLDMLEILVQERTNQLHNTIQQLNREVEERKAIEKQIKDSLMEKQVLLSEIHHRVKNSLQIVSSLMYLQQENIASNDSMQVFKQAEHRIKAMALIHETLYQTNNFTEIRYDEYLNSLINYICDSYRTNNIQVHTQIDDILLSIDTSTNCGIIIIELLTNVFKYAFPGGIEGTVTIGMQPLDNNYYRITISDNGIGFPAGVDFRKSNSLGLQLVCGLVQQLEGTIEMKRGGGTTFTITIRDTKKR